MAISVGAVLLFAVQALAEPVLAEAPVLLQWLAEQLVRFGPTILFVVCLLETALFAGLVLPVGALIAFAAVLSAAGVMEPGTVAAAALSGAVIGDQIGFSTGRWFMPQARPARGRIGRLWRGGLSRMQALIGREGLIGVSTARTIPFVRTIMPWFAGRSGMAWPRFLLFDLLGILAWGTIYIGGGFAAGYGWQRLADRFGWIAGALLIAVVVVAAAAGLRLWTRRLMRRRERRTPRTEGRSATRT